MTQTLLNTSSDEVLLTYTMPLLPREAAEEKLRNSAYLTIAVEPGGFASSAGLGEQAAEDEWGGGGAGGIRTLEGLGVKVVKV